MEAGDPMDQLKRGMRATWMAGDFGKIAEYSAREGEDFIERAGLRPGMKVLDVACGTGNTAIPAARKGADVTGLDLAPNLLEQAKQRAAAEGLTARFDEGDAEEMPYEDASFDAVTTMFGAMFAPRPERVAAEMARVTKKGGRIAMANWTPGGFVGKMFGLGAKYIAPPQGIAPPVLWGDEEKVRERLMPYASDIQTKKIQIALAYPFPPKDAVAFFREYFGPTKIAFARLEESGQADAYARDLEALWTDENSGEPGTTRVTVEYLEVVAMRV